jgi:hypothetical protein
VTLTAGLALSPEMRTLLAVVRRQMGPPAEAEAPGVDGEHADGAALATLATRHGLQGLLARAGLEAATPGSSAGATPPSALPAVAGNLERIRELHRVLNVLDAANVPAVSMKGPALAVQAWGDVSARSYGDIDVFVPPEKATETVAALEAAGYGDRWAAFGRTPSPSNWYEWAFTAPDGRTLIEIHWSLVSPQRHPSVDSTEAWADGATERVGLPGGSVRALRPELQVPYLAIHATQHHWGWLEFPLTLAALIRRSGDELDWDALLDRARRWRARRCTAVGLLLADALAGPGVLELPPEVRRTLDRDRGAAGLARWYSQQLLVAGPDSEWFRGSPSLWVRSMRMRDSALDRARAGWALLFQPTRAEWEVRPGGDGSDEAAGRAPMARVRRLWRRYRDNS